MATVDLPGGGSPSVTVSWDGYTGGAYSTGWVPPNGRQAANGTYPIIVNSIRMYSGGHGMTSVCHFWVGPYRTGDLTFGATSAAVDIGFQPIWGFFSGAAAGPQNYGIMNNGSNQFWLGRASSGATYRGDTGAVGWGGTLSGQITYVESPSAPGTPSVQGTPGSTSVTFAWTGAASDGGTAVSGYSVQIASDSGFSANLQNVISTVGSVTFTGLTPGTTYYSRVAARNLVTDGANTTSQWSGIRAFTTLNVPDAPGAPSISAIGPDAATASWAAPSNGGSAITSYDAQVATDTGFSVGVVSINNNALSANFTGLTPGTTYYSRVRANNAVGSGPWSSNATFQTLSGAKVLVSGTWVNGRAFVLVSGTWTPAKVWKNVSGTWTL